MPRALLVLGNAYHLTLRASAVITDPPYGISYRVNARRMSNRGAKLKQTGATHTNPVAPIPGDDFPFDPTPFLLANKSAFFGANHFCQKLPPGGHWVVWDKRRDSAPDDHSDCELVWVSTAGTDRIHRQKWRGVVREGEENCSRSRKLHPNQKPVALCSSLLEHLDLAPGSLILDPFMGSGSIGVAALRAGHDFLGVELVPDTFEIARARIEREGFRIDTCSAL
jgi:site-specific DNA-methyltransferase (adenine-specific)/modification methylase